MASGKRIEANRANAKKSTGPKTSESKAKSSRNALKHGLSSSFLITGECGAEFWQLRAELMDDYRPQTTLEANLVERVALILWRLRRVPGFEAGILLARQAEVVSGDAKECGEQPRWLEALLGDGKDSDDGEADKVSDEERSVHFLVYVGRALLRDCVSGEGFSKFARYETTLNNQLAKTLKMLKELRESRSGKEVEAMDQAGALPIAVRGSAWQQ